MCLGLNFDLALKEQHNLGGGGYSNRAIRRTACSFERERERETRRECRASCNEATEVGSCEQGISLRVTIRARNIWCGCATGSF
jgi:hypothetical protein